MPLQNNNTYIFTCCVIGLQSILKNYIEHEQLNTEISLSLSNMTMIKLLGKFQVQGSQIDRDFTSYLSDIHIDYEKEETKEEPVMYDIAVSNIIELRHNEEGGVNVSLREYGLILEEACTHIEEDSLLHVLWTNYKNHNVKKRVKLYTSFISYLEDMILVNEHRCAIKDQIIDIVEGMDENKQSVYWGDLCHIHDFFANRPAPQATLNLRYRRLAM